MEVLLLIIVLFIGLCLYIRSFFKEAEVMMHKHLQQIDREVKEERKQKALALSHRSDEELFKTYGPKVVG